MKALYFVVAAAALFCAIAQAECPLEGDDGGNVTFKITDGVLTLSGKGDGKMKYSSFGSYPWSSSDCKSYVTKVVVESSVHLLASNCFSGFTNLSTVTIASNPITINSYAFSGCTRLANLVISGTVDEIQGNAFASCNMTDLSFVCDNCTIRSSAFTSMSYLESLFIKGSIGTIETQAIYSLSRLRKLILPAPILKVYSNSIYSCSALDLVYYWGDRDICDGKTNMIVSCNKVGPVLVPPEYNSTFFCGSEVKKVTAPVSGASTIAVSVLVSLAMLMAALLA